jgi:hypothetical protein
MNIPENPPSFIARTEMEKAAFSNGYRLNLGTEHGWLHRASTTSRGDLWLGAASGKGPWLLSVARSEVSAELDARHSLGLPGPGTTSFTFSSLGELYAALDRVYHLGVSLPTAPLEAFEKATAALPKSTEAEQLIVRRVGQDLFRQALVSYWKGRCPLTGIVDPALLRASHIVAWTDCKSDAQRLDVHNGLLLSALWDAAFDQGLISFADNGSVLRSAQLSAEAASALDIDSAPQILSLTSGHRQNLALHRAKHGF